LDAILSGRYCIAKSEDVVTQSDLSYRFTKPAHRADQAAFAHTVKATAPSLSLGGGSDLQS
jgi:hypothetical protein